MSMRENLLLQARKMRSNPTDAEKKLWSFIRDRQLDGIKFRRQHVIDRFIVDFYCPEVKLVIEIDGEIHKSQVSYDRAREQWLEERGYLILRFKNNQVQNQIEIVLNMIANQFSTLKI